AMGLSSSSSPRMEG
ncbi:hypothetical protein A2U01_0117681, partial [Trifolium medium]|nr:hypothetical protein [Trifolium medium]